MSYHNWVRRSGLLWWLLNDDDENFDNHDGGDDDGRLKMGSYDDDDGYDDNHDADDNWKSKKGEGVGGPHWGGADTPIISLSLGGQLPFLQCATVHWYILQKYNCIIVQCTLHSALQSRSLHHTVTQCANVHLINTMC